MSYKPRSFLISPVRGKDPATYAAVVKDYMIPNAWRVEKLNNDGDGGVDVTIFAGPNAYARALEYGTQKYGTVHAPEPAAQPPIPVPPAPEAPKEQNAPLMLLQAEERMRVLYKNWRGETRERHIEFDGVVFWCRTEWHPEPQWMVAGTDLENGEHRVFAVKDMVPLAPLPTPAGRAFSAAEPPSPEALEAAKDIRQEWLKIVQAARDRVQDALLNNAPEIHFGKYGGLVAELTDVLTEARQEAVAWAVSRWRAEVSNRPLVNVHRRSLDDAWRQVIRHFGGDDAGLCGPAHDDLVTASAAARPAAPAKLPNDAEARARAVIANITYQDGFIRNNAVRIIAAALAEAWKETKEECERAAEASVAKAIYDIADKI